MIMKKPEVDVIRFSCSDVVAASSPTMTWSKFGDNTAKNGIVNYNGQTYTIDSADSITSLYTAMSGIGVTDSTRIDNNTSNEKMKAVLNLEAGGRENGVRSPLWNGTYIYENGVFTKKT
jgi:hypothetical protein